MADPAVETKVLVEDKNAAVEANVGVSNSDVDAKKLEDDSDSDSDLDKKKYDEEDYDLDQYPVRDISFQLGFLKDPIYFNPVVTFFGISILWGLAAWCMRKLITC